ncbi:MAG: hypothetical protein JWQ67_1981 [Marmoricola sp.]|nr:hypothetical protein [Marmoricola sp.]
MIGLAAGMVVLAGVGAVSAPRMLPSCGREVTRVSAAESTSPFLDAEGRRPRPDRDRDALVASLDAAPPPFGEVLGAVGYHYEQWAQVDGFAQGIGIRTRDNPDFTMLDDATLKPLWSVKIGTRRSTYDASDSRYVVATMPTGAAPDVIALDAADGRRLWCAGLGERVLGADDAFATQIVDDGGVVVLAPGSGTGERVVRLSGKDGSQVWERTVTADEGDFLGSLGDGVLLAGGSAHETLVEPGAPGQPAAGAALVALSAADGEQRWTRSVSRGSGVHVIGTDPDAGIAVVEERTGATGRLVALDRSGHEIWSVTPTAPGIFDATVRAGRVLVRSGNRWSAYGLGDGRRVWQRSVPREPQFLPYGFELGNVPLLDTDHALVGGTTALHTLDLRTGAMIPAALPTDGINTTYWPYQVAVSPGLIAVATNTGAAVVRRE